MNYTLLFFITGVIYVYTGIHTLSKDRSHPLNRLYFFITILCAFWSFVNASLFLITNPYIAANARRYMVFSWGVVYSAILHLALYVSGFQKRFGKKILHPLIYGPAFINIYLYFFNAYDSSDLRLTDNGWIIANYYKNNFLWDHYFNIYYLTCLLFTFLTLSIWYFKTKVTREKKQANILLYTLMFAFVGGTVFEIILPMFGKTIVYSSTLLIGLVPILGISYSIEKYGLMNFNIKHRSYEILDHMDEGFIICDNAGKILSINRGGERLINGNTAHPVTNIFDLELINPYLPFDDEDKAIELINGDGEILKIILNITPLDDSIGEPIGYMILVQDITQLANSQKKLERLNQELEDKVNERTRALSIANDTLKTQITIRKRAEESNQRMAFTDSLTGLPNGRHLITMIDDRVSNGKQSKFMLLFFDLDDFKTINDIKGHNFGDALLISIGNRLKKRMSDNVFIARKGGDEFYIIIDHNEDELTPEYVANEIMTLLNAPYSIASQTVTIESSMGICEYPKHGTTYHELMKYVDLAMYKAKAKGKNTYAVFNDNMYNKLIWEQGLIDEFDRAIANDEFILHYQPQILSSDGSIVGVEALIRWQHPKHGLLSPLSFIELAEKSGHIDKIGQWVIENAFAAKNDWNTQGLIDMDVSINLSVHQLYDETLIPFIYKVKDLYDIAMEKIHFEITENIFLSNDTIILDTIKILYDMGTKIVIDDFGIEYSTLNYLKKLPLSAIKIDKSFIDGINHSKVDHAIIKALMVLSEDLGISVVAEGVEIAEQVDFLNALHCEIHQGYYYFKPLSEEDLVKLCSPMVDTRIVINQYSTERTSSH